MLACEFVALKYSLCWFVGLSLLHVAFLFFLLKNPSVDPATLFFFFFFLCELFLSRLISLLLICSYRAFSLSVCLCECVLKILFSFFIGF